MDQNKVTTRHCGPLEARVSRVYFIRETKRNENSPKTSDFDFENLFITSTVRQQIINTRLHDCWLVTGKRSHA